jgi:malate dehydrogenase
MKLAIIGGGGLLGSTTAFYLGSLNILSQIKLIDINENILMSHVMDLEQAFTSVSTTQIVKADYNEIDDCDIILITASLPERRVASRNEFLQGNLGIIQNILREIGNLQRDKIIINATNPVDVLNYYIYKKHNCNRNRIIGFSLNDTVRFKWAIAKLTGLNAKKIKAYCLGEHGDNKVPIFSKIYYKDEKVLLGEEQKDTIQRKINNWFKEYQALNSGRTSGWTSAIGLTSIIKAIIEDNQVVIPCSAILEGEYDAEGVSAGVPLKLGNKGIEGVVDIDISKDERKLFNEATIKIKNIISTII